MPSTKKTIRVCYVLSYKAPDYIRTRVLLRSLEQMPGVELHKAVNTHKGILRYGETLAKALYIRLRHNPDVFILGFRGQEIFWPVRLISAGKKLVFDEFVNMYDWMAVEKKILREGSLSARFIKKINGLMLKKADLILEDTDLNAEYSSKVHNVNRGKYATVYVGADESVFYPRVKPKSAGKSLEVFFYGTMLPLHGVEHIIRAAILLKNKKIRITLVGAGNKREYIERKIKENGLKNVRYIDWVDFHKIPEMIENADVCLGGPFGDTSQAGRVITGKTFQFLAMAKPVVISETEKIGFADKKNAIICERGSAESLAGALEWCLDNKSKLDTIGQNGLKLYKEKFSEKQVQKQLESAIGKPA